MVLLTSWATRDRRFIFPCKAFAVKCYCSLAGLQGIDDLCPVEFISSQNSGTGFKRILRNLLCQTDVLILSGYSVTCLP